MGKPRMIILIRHAQSEGNKIALRRPINLTYDKENRDIHQTIPDHRVKLTPEGWTQAYDAGRRLRSLLRADDTLHFFTSPYRRTRETTEGILSTLTSDDPSPTPFPRNSIKVYEEPRLREQDFGNFQPCSAEMERMWQERADYGHFFYRIPNGESAADAYDRVSGFNESLWRQFGEDDFASVCVLVTHGLMSRVFLMKWYHFSVEYFEDLRNVNHCEFLIMRKKEDSGKYILENHLRTWSDLRRDRERLAAAASTKEKNTTKSATEKDKDREREKERKLLGGVEPATAIPASPQIPVRKKWGGCPNGCDHNKQHYHKKGDNSMHPMEVNAAKSTVLIGSQADILPLRRVPSARRWQSSSEEDEDDPRGRIGPPQQVDVQKSLDEVISSPDGTPSFITVNDRQHLRSPKNEVLIKSAGRDFGGSHSGNASQGGSDTEFSPTEQKLKKARASKKRTVLGNGVDKKKGREESAMGRGAMADALGDQTDPESGGSEADLDVKIMKRLDVKDVQEEVQRIARQEAEEKSVKGSVY